MTTHDKQFDRNGQLRHLLSIKGLSQSTFLALLDEAENIIADQTYAKAQAKIIAGKTIANLFFEPSTRTRISFELAAKRLGAEVINFETASSSTVKGETLLDTVKTLEAMHIDAFVLRHKEEGTSRFVAEALQHTKVINAGDGISEHPTQALLDMLTIRQRKGEISKLKVAIVGDVAHSRVARSAIHALKLLDVAELRIIAPQELITQDICDQGVQIYHDFDEGISHVDVVMMLRVQRERMPENVFPNPEKYFKSFGLDKRRLLLADAQAIVMHPGPLNRGIEIAEDVADGPQSVILQQVTNGVAVRMAVLKKLLTDTSSESF